MSKNLIDKLIEQVLAEKINVDLKGVTNKKDLKQKLGLPASPPPKYSDIDALRKKDNDFENLTDKDVEKAYDIRINKTSAFKGAEFIRQNTKDLELASDVDTIYKNSDYYQKIKTAQAKDIFVFQLDPNDDRKVVRSAGNIAKVKYLADLVDDKSADDQVRKKAFTTLVDLATNKLAGISLVQDVLGSEGRVPKSLIKKFKSSKLAKERLPAKAPKDEPAMTISDPAISTGGSDQAKYRAELINVFSTVAQIGNAGSDALKSEKFWTDSLKLISDFSSFVDSGETQNETLLNLTATEYLSLTIALDYCYRFVKEIEGGGGAFQFEAFLGLLANGYVGGKEAGIAGGPGEADFVIQTKDAKGNLVPAMGSAKYYASLAASQSARSFELNTPVAYVYALKRGSNDGFTSDTKKVVVVDNHIFTIMKVYGKGIDPQQPIDPLQEGSGGEAKSLGKIFGDEQKAQVGTGRVVFKFTNTVTGEIIGYYGTDALGQIALQPGVLGTKPAGSISLPLLDRNSLVKAHKASSAKVSTQVNSAFESFKDLFKNLIEAKKKATEYSTNADKNTGVAALNAITSSKNDLLKLSASIAKPGDAALDATQLEESKPPIDQLIESIINKKLLK